MERDGEKTRKFDGVDQRFAVATHALRVLAVRGQAVSSAQFISENISVSAIIIKRVMRPIVLAGYVEAVAGAVGGYRPIRDDEEITFGSCLKRSRAAVRFQSASGCRSPIATRGARSTGSSMTFIPRARRWRRAVAGGILGLHPAIGHVAASAPRIAPRRPKGAPRESALAERRRHRRESVDGATDTCSCPLR